MPNLKSKDLFNLIDSGERSSKLIFEYGSAEKYIGYFLMFRKAFNDAYDRIRDDLAEKGIKTIGKDFSGISGALVRGSYSGRGAKYTYSPDPSQTEDPDFVTKKISYSVDSKAVDKYLKENGELPAGVTVASRKKSLSLSATNEIKEVFEANLEELQKMDFQIQIPENLESSEPDEEEDVKA